MIFDIVEVHPNTVYPWRSVMHINHDKSSFLKNRSRKDRPRKGLKKQKAVFSVSLYDITKITQFSVLSQMLFRRKVVQMLR